MAANPFLIFPGFGIAGADSKVWKRKKPLQIGEAFFQEFRYQNYAFAFLAALAAAFFAAVHALHVFSAVHALHATFAGAAGHTAHSALLASALFATQGAQVSHANAAEPATIRAMAIILIVFFISWSPCFKLTNCTL
jgi:hypothetical protein